MVSGVGNKGRENLKIAKGDLELKKVGGEREKESKGNFDLKITYLILQNTHITKKKRKEGEKKREK